MAVRVREVVPSQLAGLDPTNLVMVMADDLAAYDPRPVDEKLHRSLADPEWTNAKLLSDGDVDAHLFAQFPL
jgi:hypothetical protein